MRELKGKERIKGLDIIRGVPFNTLFAESVLKGYAEGRVFTDDSEEIKTMYIAHSYGMSLLCGEYSEGFFNDLTLYFNDINKSQWVQFYPYQWEKAFRVLEEEGRINKFKRYNLDFNFNRYIENLKDVNLNDYKIIKATVEDLKNFQGVVVPKFFWNEDNIDKCKGFIVLKGEERVAIAFSSCISGNKLEIGIETKEGHRREGLGSVAAKALIEYSLENNYELIWACKHDNYPSLNSAKKVGFEKVFEGPYFELINL